MLAYFVNNPFLAFSRRIDLSFIWPLSIYSHFVHLLAMSQLLHKKSNAQNKRPKENVDLKEEAGF